MKSLKRSFALLLFVSICFPATLISQNFEDFQKSILVDIPGDNYDFDLLSGGMPYPFYDFYITWVNRSDSLYTIYLKKVTPETIDSNIIISSGNIIKSNPQIDYNSSGPGISIVWEDFTDGYYRIVSRDYTDSAISNEAVLIDSLNEDPQITMNYNHLAWIEEANLYLKEMYPVPASTILLDSSCTAPSLITDVSWAGYLALIYEKSFGSDHHIYLAYKDYPGTTWFYSEFADGDNRNPEFGAGDGFSFESIENGIHKINFFPYFVTEAYFWTTGNTSSNYNNPDVFSYPQVTDQEDTPFFIVFDTDSIENNREVMVQSFAYGDQFFNLSDMEGADYKPKADLMLYNNIAYVVILWEHRDGVHSTIWMAKTIIPSCRGC